MRKGKQVDERIGVNSIEDMILERAGLDLSEMRLLPHMGEDGKWYQNRQQWSQ